MDYADRVRELTQTQGTGPLALAGPVTGFRTFASVLVIGAACYYAVEAISPTGVPRGDWEVGVGTYTAPNTLERTTVLSSSNANAPVNFAPGDKHVWLDYPAAAIAGALTQAQADALYLTEAEADALFLTQAEADALFLTQAEGDARYLTPAAADAAYLTEAEADALFLTQAEGDARYLAKLAQAIDAAKLLGATWTSPPDIGTGVRAKGYFSQMIVGAAADDGSGRLLQVAGSMRATGVIIGGPAGFQNGTGFATDGGISVGVGAVNAGPTGNQINLFNSSQNQLSLNSGGLNLNMNMFVGWGSTVLAGSQDTKLFRDGAGIIAARNGVTPHAHRVYNTYTDISNFERAEFGWSANLFRIFTQSQGTGTARDIEIAPAAGTLRVAGNIVATKGVGLMCKAGAVTDADFVNPVDGMIALDVTNSRIYARIGGAWKSALLA